MNRSNYRFIIQYSQDLITEFLSMFERFLFANREYTKKPFTRSIVIIADLIIDGIIKKPKKKGGILL